MKRKVLSLLLAFALMLPLLPGTARAEEAEAPPVLEEPAEAALPGDLNLSGPAKEPGQADTTFVPDNEAGATEEPENLHTMGDEGSSDTGGEESASIAQDSSATVEKNGSYGKNGDNIQYTLYSDGTLVISGSGEMVDCLFASLSAPWGTSKVKRAIIEEGVTSIGQSAFRDNKNMESISLPESLTAISSYAFEGCTALKDLQLPEKLEGIGSYSFCECSALTSVTIPQSVRTVGSGAFRGCTAMTQAEVHCQLNIPSNAFPGTCNVIRYGTASGECGKTPGSLTWTLEESGVLTIRGSGEMQDWESTPPWARTEKGMYPIKSVVLEAGVTSIGECAFLECGTLEHIELPEHLTAIGKDAFYGCTALKDLQLPEGLTSIGIRAFFDCKALTEIDLPQSLQSIGEKAFQDSGLNRARVYYLTDYKSAGLPAGCILTLYGKTLTPSAPLEATRTAPAGSDNIHSQNYIRWSAPVKSYLAPTDDGGFYRVEYYYHADYITSQEYTHLVMEEYDRKGAFLQGWDIPMELPVFGGFYSGTDGFYFVFGQNNLNDDDNVEVLRVVKYSKDLERLGDARLMGGNTFLPFEAASCRMDEGNGLLYIHTGHEMYKDPDDNLHHQACMTFSVNTAIMEFQYQSYDVSHYRNNGYVSHSFNQFIRVDGTKVVRLDHGDGYPRGAGLFVNGPNLNERPLYAVPFSFYGSAGENTTGASVGGLEVSENGYLIALSSVDQNSGNRNRNKTRNVYLLAANKEGLTASKEVQLTDYSEGGAYSTSTPQLVKLSENRFLLLWEEQLRGDDYGGYKYSQYSGTVKYAFFDGAGTQLGSIRTMNGALSDCQPVVIDGKATWYVTENSGDPVFYQIDHEGNASTFTHSIGQKPVSVRLPENVLAELDSCETILAATYNVEGRLSGIAAGKLKNGKAVFSQEVGEGWKLYFLDEESRPLCEAYEAGTVQ